MDERPSVLVVDDDAAVRTGIQQLLEQEGYAVSCAENGRQALDFLDTSPAPSLVLLDLGMPVVDGWQFLLERERRSNAAARSAPVVLMSGMDFIRDARGFADFLRKPVDSSRLLSCVRRLCRSPSTHPART